MKEVNNYNSYETNIYSLTLEFSKNDDYIRATIKTFACLLYGSLEAVVPGEGLNKSKMVKIKIFFKFIFRFFSYSSPNSSCITLLIFFFLFIYYSDIEIS